MDHQPVADWQSATTDQRKRLYQAIALAAQVRRETVGVTITTALGAYVRMGKDYESNFRQGKIGRSLCPIVHDWLVKHHPMEARQAAPELFPLDRYHLWERALTEYAQPNHLRLVTLKRSLGLIQRADSVKPVDATLRLGDAFCFEVDAPFAGQLYGYQWYASIWHPMLLRPDEKPGPLRIEAGLQLLPRDARTGEIIPMVEATDIGVHRFAVAIVKRGQSMPDDLTQLRELPQGAVIATQRVRFTSD